MCATKNKHTKIRLTLGCLQSKRDHEQKPTLWTNILLCRSKVKNTSIYITAAAFFWLCIFNMMIKCTVTCKQWQFVTKEQHTYICTIMQWTQNNDKYAYSTSEHTKSTM